MKTTLSTSGSKLSLGLLVLLIAAAVLPVARSQDTNGVAQSIPLIKMENVPLTDAIRNLARQTGRNYILDPRLSPPWTRFNGREPALTLRWENLTADQALKRLLTEHGLIWVDNPATSIARIGFTNTALKPVPASLVGNGTNPVVSLIVFDSVPLTVAIKNLAREAHLEYSLDPEMPLPFAGSSRHTLSRCEVSARWKEVSVRQALAALLDNYDLTLEQAPGSASVRIVPKAPESQKH